MDILGGAPRVLGYPRPVVTQCGTDAILRCQIGGDPRPNVIWERKNVQILSEGRYKISEEGKAYLLTIARVTQEDAGQYICKARNSIGETYAAASLKVEELPGHNREIIQFKKNGINENGDFGESLNGYNMMENSANKKEMNGEHKGNSQANDPLQEFDLTSNDKPRFLIKPLSLRVDRGEDAAFSCKIWGTPLPEVTWEKDGKKLNDIFESSHFSVSIQDGGWFQLKIHMTRMPDKGVYTCKAANCHGEVLAGAVLLVEPIPERGESKMSSNSHISSPRLPKHRSGRFSLSKLTEEPPVNVSKVKKFVVTEGKHAKFRCFVTGKPKPEIIWKKDGVPLEPNRRHLVFEDREGYYTLKVLYCKLEDTGLYLCAASNTLGNTLSAVHLTVKGPTVRFRRPLKDVDVKERDVAVLECEVPDETIPAAWYLEDQRLMPSSKYGMEQKGTRRRLTIHDVGTDDDGVYLCEMPDGAKSIAELAVKGTIVRKLPRKLEVLEGENAAFCVEVESDDMEVHWFKDGLKLHETHQTILKSFGKTHILVFVNVAYHDSGVVTFVVGRSKSSSRLKVKATRHCPPICPVGVKMSVDTPNCAFLTWMPASNSQTNTRSMFVLEHQEVGSQEWQKCFTSETTTSAEVSGDSVPCEGDYRFRVCCINKYGRSGHVEFPKVVHLVPGPKIHKHLQGCEVMEGEDAHFFIELSTPMVGTWFLNSSQLQHGGRYSVQQNQAKHSLVIHETRTSEDTAEITFIANGVRDSAVLKVKPAVLKFIPQSELDRNKRVETGDTIVLYCEVTHPFGKVSWFKDGEELQVSDGLNIQSDGNMRRIVIQSAEASHSGVYTCETSGDVIEFNVDVKGPPVEFNPMSEEELHKNSMELDPVVLLCHVSRDDAEVTWYKDGCEIQPSDNITLQAEGTMRRLIIRSAEASDAGNYTCNSGNNSIEFIVNVREPPVTIVEPNNDIVMTYYVSEEINLQCELSRSKGKVCWFKDGQEVQESDIIQIKSEGPYRRLTIPCGSTVDSGEYVCETDGDSVFFQITVTEPPVRILSPSQSEVELTHLTKERLELCCEVSQVDAPVRWYKDNLEVEESPNLILEVDKAQRRLVIPLTTVNDTGEYICDTENDSVTFLVNITEPPVTLSPLKPMLDKLEGFAGEPIILELEVSRPTAEVKWLHKGKEIEQRSDITITEDGVLRRLTINCPTPKDSGKYTCDAVDDTMDFQVAVSEPPVKILKKPEIKNDLKFLVSDDIVLECELSRANGNGKWYKDGCRVQGDERFCEEEEGAFRSLVILNAELNDSGEYFLDVGDDSISFKVTVEEPPVRIVGNSYDPDYQELMAGDDLILACEVSRSNAPVQWYCNDKLLNSNSRTFIESCGTLRKLIISNMQPADSGKYVCDAVNDKLINIIRIQEPPVTFVNKEDDIVVTGYEAESVTLTSYVSKESALVRWLKDWTPVEGERFRELMDGHKRSLTIQPVRRSDAGEYTCDANTDQMHFSLLVKEMRIKFVRPLYDTVAHADGMVTLRCEVCKPKADVQWLKNGVEVVGSRRFSIRADGVERSLTIHRLTQEDAGQYVCESRDDRTAAVLRVEMPRVVEFLTELHNTTVLEGEDATFKCVVSPEDVRLVWLMDNEPIVLGDRFQASRNGLCHTLVIKKCQIMDSSKITAEAEEKISKASLKVQEAQVMFTRKMAAVTAEEFGEATLETEISLETGEVQWMRQGVVIQSGPRHTLTQDGFKRSLTIHNLTLSDRGTYRCETLHDRTQVKLNVEPRKISIRKGLTDQETFEREPASFEVELSHADVEGIWQKDGIRVKPNNQFRVSVNGLVHSLTLTNLTLEDTGTIVFSAEGVRSTARLTVKETPVAILKPLADVRVEEELPVTLECEFSRHNVEVRWLKNGSELKPGKNHRIYSMGRKRFCQILQCSVADSGSYTCDTGEISTFCSLEVYEHELRIVQDLEDLCVQEDQNAVFMCEVSLEDVPGEWYNEGHKIRPSSTVRIRNEGTKHFLLMCNVKAEDAGEIRFVARDVESTAYLEVEDLPVSIVKPLRDRTALEKHRVILECTVSSPRCSATWYKGKEELDSSDRMEIIAEGCSHKLVIHQVAVEDEGTYSIEVGEHTSKAKLLVEAQTLVMVKELEDVEVMEPEPAYFQCEVSVAISKPPVWTLNGSTLHSGPSVRLEDHGTVHKLTLRDTNVDMSGTIKFTLGKAKSSATFTVIEK
ncbi:obscurin-like protein 1a isoform X1 [Fundulus heteroclitus]|uniref:obscurin-like protein 1a isoform X1 n=2 Tax=Fundulus heteroclitus TaxID=8078 RepID=UPI00165C5A83|nr:obscurin-like protein 1a isoform X1 [Fundulus heteroclitus]XP_021170168.2 obscurin-like protein 1a isoform X1 [Fundulus heteroclitus]